MAKALSCEDAAMKNDDHLKSVGLRNLPRSRPVAISFAVLFGGMLLLPMAGDTGAQNRDELRPPAAFAGITDPQARSRPLFPKPPKASMSRAAMTCNPAVTRPRQG